MVLSPTANNSSGQSGKSSAAATNFATSKEYVKTIGSFPVPGMAAVLFAMSKTKVKGPW